MKDMIIENMNSIDALYRQIVALLDLMQCSGECVDADSYRTSSEMCVTMLDDMKNCVDNIFDDVMDMVKEVEAKTTIKYEDYYVMRGVKIDDNDVKEVVAEQTCKTKPTEQEIVDFLIGGEMVFDFMSLEHNYRLV